MQKNRTKTFQRSIETCNLSKTINNSTITKRHQSTRRELYHVYAQALQDYTSNPGSEVTHVSRLSNYKIKHELQIWFKHFHQYFINVIEA